MMEKENLSEEQKIKLEADRWNNFGDMFPDDWQLRRKIFVAKQSAAKQSGVKLKKKLDRASDLASYRQSKINEIKAILESGGVSIREACLKIGFNQSRIYVWDEYKQLAEFSTRKVSAERHEEIKSLLAAGKRVPEIAKTVGVSRAHVYFVIKKLED